MKIILKNSIDDLNAMVNFLEDFFERYKISMSDSYNINLALEEIFSNILMYAYDDDGEHEIELGLNKENDEIIAVIRDDGKEFNVLDVPPPDDINKDASERKIGGLGIHFVRNLMDKVDYKREGNYNVLTIKKVLNK